MKQPEGFEVKGKEDYVCKLNESIYGLKQSPRQWNRRFDEFMADIQFHRSHYDNCVYFKFPSKVEFVILLLYVDDILIASNSKSKVEKLKSKLSREFEMKDLGAAKRILGIEIKRDRKRKLLYLDARN